MSFLPPLVEVWRDTEEQLVPQALSHSPLAHSCTVTPQTCHLSNSNTELSQTTTMTRHRPTLHKEAVNLLLFDENNTYKVIETHSLNIAPCTSLVEFFIFLKWAFCRSCTANCLTGNSKRYKWSHAHLKLHINLLEKHTCTLKVSHEPFGRTMVKASL